MEKQEKKCPFCEGQEMFKFVGEKNIYNCPKCFRNYICEHGELKKTLKSPKASFESKLDEIERKLVEKTETRKYSPSPEKESKQYRWIEEAFDYYVQLDAKQIWAQWETLLDDPEKDGKKFKAPKKMSVDQIGFILKRLENDGVIKYWLQANAFIGAAYKTVFEKFDFKAKAKMKGAK